jgi:hypothetical protein
MWKTRFAMVECEEWPRQCAKSDIAIVDDRVYGIILGRDLSMPEESYGFGAAPVALVKGARVGIFVNAYVEKEDGIEFLGKRRLVSDVRGFGARVDGSSVGNSNVRSVGYLKASNVSVSLIGNVVNVVLSPPLRIRTVRPKYMQKSPTEVGIPIRRT